MKSLSTIAITCLFLSACGKDTSSKSSGGAPAPTAEKKVVSTTLNQDPKKLVPPIKQTRDQRTSQQAPSGDPSTTDQAAPGQQSPPAGQASPGQASPGQAAPGQQKQTPPVGQAAPGQQAPSQGQSQKHSSKPSQQKSSQQKKQSQKSSQGQAAPGQQAPYKGEAAPGQRSPQPQPPYSGGSQPYQGEGEQYPAPKTPPPSRGGICCGGTGESAETGAYASAGMSYVSLVNDGLMNSLKRRVNRGDTMSKNLSASLMNGKLFIDPITGDVNITVKVLENGMMASYNFVSARAGDRMVPMQLVSAGPYSVTTGRYDLQASVACVDASGRCRVAVMKLQTGYGSPAPAQAYMIFRQVVTDMKFRMTTPTPSRELWTINNFFVQSEVATSGPNQVQDAFLETFEVAYGASIVRTVVIGKNGEILSQVGPLMGSSHLNWQMRLLESNYEDIDRADLNYHTVYMSSMLASAHLLSVDGQGGIVVGYQLKSQCSQNCDQGFVIQYCAHSTPISNLY